MIAFLFGLFVVVFVCVGIIKIFGSKIVIKSIITYIALIAGGIIGIMLLFKLISVIGADNIRSMLGYGIIIFVLVAIIAIIAVVARFFGGKAVAKFILTTISTIAFTALAIGAVVFVWQSLF
ncbi:hypothetical protein ACWIUD_08550 [Helicobacter sp. 23-1044]